MEQKRASPTNHLSPSTVSAPQRMVKALKMNLRSKHHRGLDEVDPMHSKDLDDPHANIQMVA